MLDNSCRRAYTVFMRGFGNYSILSFGTAVTNNIANASQACTENNLEGSASNKVSGLCFSGRAINHSYLHGGRILFVAQKPSSFNCLLDKMSGSSGRDRVKSGECKNDFKTPAFLNALSYIQQSTQRKNPINSESLEAHSCVWSGVPLSFSSACR